jgi:drug/metabolite transporter (DMT)-like permease
VRSRPLLASTGLVITWSSGFVGAELSTRANAAPLTVLGWRFIVLSGVLIVACLLTRTSLRSGESWLRQGALAVPCQAAYLGLVFEGVHQGVAAGTSALIAALQPLLVATVAGRLLGERSTPIMWLGMVLGLGGVAVVVSGDLESGGTPTWAYVLPVAGTLSLAAGTVLTRRLRPPEAMLQTITMQAVFAAVAFMATAALAGEAAPPTRPKAWLAIAWLIMFASLGGYVLYIHVTHTLGATVVSTLLYLTPPITMLWAFVMFGDPVTGLGFLGLAISGVGVFLALRGRRFDHSTTHKASCTTLVVDIPSEV